jgi:hypothetical protein
MKRLSSFRLPVAFAIILVSVVAIGTGQASALVPPDEGQRADPINIGSDAGASAVCPDGYLCIYWDRSGGSSNAGLGFYYCRTVNLADWGWQNAMSRLNNNQSEGTVSYFYDDAYSSSTPIMAQRAPGHRANLAQDTAPDGRSENDRIDRIKVC